MLYLISSIHVIILIHLTQQCLLSFIYLLLFLKSSFVKPNLAPISHSLWRLRKLWTLSCRGSVEMETSCFQSALNSSQDSNVGVKHSPVLFSLAVTLQPSCFFLPLMVIASSPPETIQTRRVPDRPGPRGWRRRSRLEGCHHIVPQSSLFFFMWGLSLRSGP